MSRVQDAHELRARLGAAHLMLVFTPELCAGRDPLEVLADCLPWIDVLQIRPKPLGQDASQGPAFASETYSWCQRALELIGTGDSAPLVIVNDRVDVAAALQGAGCAGVHLGQEDCPLDVARELLGAQALIGLSTHDLRQVAASGESSADYLGFGPFRPTNTKGYSRGLGPERCRVADQGTPLPLFPIGGIEATNMQELAPIGRAAIGSAILAAAEPGRAAHELRELLLAPE